MKMKFFINRPIFAICISVMIVLLGVIGLVSLPIEQYPDIAPPTVMVSATYTGASAETVRDAVIVPLEEQINGVENMTYMVSTATNSGSAYIQVYFKHGTDPDMAAVNVQNRVSAAQGDLPSEVVKIGVTTQKRQSSQLKLMALYDETDTYDAEFLSNYLKINVVPKIKRITGVGEVMVMGGDYAMRIWLNPELMAQHNLVPQDIVDVLGEQNIESPTGNLGENSDNAFQYTLKYRGRYETPEEFGELVIKADENGNVLRLKDVARIELGLSTYSYLSTVNGHNGVSLSVMQTSGSNANEIIKEIDKVADEVRADMPASLKLVDMMSTNDFLYESIDSVIETLIEAILLVILVVFVFLQNFRASFIPLVGIIVSLIGTFAFIYIMGYSLNLITLFALVLVIGTVVDDSIVVVEAVQAKFDEGYQSPYKATTDAMGGIASAILTTSLVFMAIFIPVSFMGGTTGVFYSEFGLTMAAAVGISALNALTLSPALCSLIMRPEPGKGQKTTFTQRFHTSFTASFGALIAKYKKGVLFLFRHKWVPATIAGVMIVLLIVFFKTTKTGFIPNEDQGTIFVSVTAAPGTTLEQTNEIINEVGDRIKDLPQIQLYSVIGGYSLMSGSQSSSMGTLVIRLKHWKYRKGKENSVNEVINQIFARTADIKNAQVYAFAPPQIMGYGSSNGLEIYLQDKKGGDMNTFFGYAQDFIAKLQDRPEIKSAITQFNPNYPQYLVEVDAARCKSANVSPSDVLSVLSAYVGGNYASNINRFSKIYRVMIQADVDYRLDKEALNNMYVRTSTGEMAPIGQFMTLTKTYGAESINRFNLFNSISVSAMPEDGYSSGDAIRAVREVADESLPEGYGFEFGGSTRDEASSSSSTIFIFIICVVFVYIILCSLYESVFIPMAVILSIPFGLFGSFLFAKIFGVENNIYMQVGLIMIMGLLAKTAILLTEYASTRRREGMGIGQAALSAAGVRLRPILMTALTMIFGLLPMLFASGAGANGEISIAVSAVGGMLVGSFSLLFIVPLLFIVFQTIEEKVMPKRKIEE
jgi:hydrophobe/amphiphile efflux-1 (HAE1) family protein